MSQPFVGEIRMFGGSFAPRSWAFCNGQVLPITQNQALFALIGTIYGGNGTSTFSLPDLRGRLPIGQGTGSGLTPRVAGELGGVEDVTLLTATMPAHTHRLEASSVTATTNAIASNVLPGIVTPAPGHFYVTNDGSTPAPTFGALAQQSVTSTGGGTPHSNLMPALCVSFIIALSGVFPSRN